MVSKTRGETLFRWRTKSRHGVTNYTVLKLRMKCKSGYKCSCKLKRYKIKYENMYYNCNFFRNPRVQSWPRQFQMWCFFLYEEAFHRFNRDVILLVLNVSFFSLKHLKRERDIMFFFSSVIFCYKDEVQITK